MDFAGSINNGPHDVFRFRVEKIKSQIAANSSDIGPKFRLLNLRISSSVSEVVKALVESIKLIRDSYQTSQRLSPRILAKKVDGILKQCPRSDDCPCVTTVPAKLSSDDADDIFDGDFLKLINYIEQVQCDFASDPAVGDLSKVVHTVVSFIYIAYIVRPRDSAESAPSQFRPQSHSSPNARTSLTSTAPTHLTPPEQSTSKQVGENLTRNLTGRSEVSRQKQENLGEIIENFRSKVGAATRPLAPKIAVVNFQHITPADSIIVATVFDLALTSLHESGINSHTSPLVNLWQWVDRFSPILSSNSLLANGKAELVIKSFNTKDTPNTNTLVVDLISLKSLVAEIQDSDPSDRFYQDRIGLLALLFHLFFFFSKQQSHLNIAYQVGVDTANRQSLVAEEEAFYRNIGISRQSTSSGRYENAPSHLYDVPARRVSSNRDHIYNTPEHNSLSSSRSSGPSESLAGSTGEHHPLGSNSSRRPLVEESPTSDDPENMWAGDRHGERRRDARSTNPFHGHSTDSEDSLSDAPWNSRRPSSGFGRDRRQSDGFGERSRSRRDCRYRDDPPPRREHNRSKLPVPKFGNNINVEEFLRKFDYVLNKLRVPEDERVAHLEESVINTTAEPWLKRFLFFNKRDCGWDKVSKAFIRHFSSEFDTDAAFYDMEACVMKDDQPVTEYVDSKLLLLAKCDPDMKLKDQIRHIEKGLLDKYRELLFNQSFKDVESLRDHLRLIEGKVNRFLKEKKKNNVTITESPVSAVSTGNDVDPRLVKSMVCAFQQLGLGSGRSRQRSDEGSRRRETTPYRSDRSSSRSSAGSVYRSADRRDDRRDRPYRSRDRGDRRDGRQSRDRRDDRRDRYRSRDSSDRDRRRSRHDSGSRHRRSDRDDKRQRSRDRDASRESRGSAQSSRQGSRDRNSSSEQNKKSGSKNGKK